MPSCPKANDILRRIVPWTLNLRTNYKGTRGRIGIVGGARDYAGAPYFASISAMRLGADLAYVICSQTASQSIKNYSPDLIVTPLLDHPNEEQFETEMDCLMSRLHALVVGPGLGREKLLQKRARQLIDRAKARSLPLVLDADGLMMVTQDPSIFKSYSKVILTPNRIELQRLLNCMYAPKTFDLRSIQNEELKDLVRQCSKDLNVTILSKGMIDIISSGSSDFQLVTDEQSGSSRRCGGQGDILSGLAGTYLHWIEQTNREQNGEKIGNSTAWAAYFAAITTRLSNELAYKEYKNGMLASQMIDKVQIALNSMLEGSCTNEQDSKTKYHYKATFTKDEISRYTRQMIMDEFGPERQINLSKASVLIIGAGGLGCPSAVYLGAAGIGRIGIVDDDRVESSNLHRQVLHNVKKIGMLKTESIREAIIDINPNVKVDCHTVRMTRHNAVELIEKYDIVVDATDNLLARYMISDACVVAKKPLVSGAALKMDGQLTVYNYDENSPCFRCLFPVPPPPNAVGSCSDNGVLGVIPGVIGVQQALEAIKIGSGIRPAYAGKMLLFDGQLGLFRQITLNKKKSDCFACGSESKLDRNLIDYNELLGPIQCDSGASTNSANILSVEERITVEQYRDILESEKPHVLVDVRPSAHSRVSRFAHALAIPLPELLEENTAKRILDELKSKGTNELYVVCRRGIASQRGTKAIQGILAENGYPSDQFMVKDIIGGMTAWSKHIDPNYSCL